MLDRSEISEFEFYVSTFSGGGNCVAVAKLPSGDYAVRNSQMNDTAIVFTRAEWKAFVTGVKASEFDF